ncbi:hypothetical protein ACVWZ3_002905 [Bradyrhizobium sp. i1.3.6]
MKWTLSAILMLIPVSLLPCTLHATSLELTAPSSAAKAAYDTLTKHFPPNPQPGNKRFVTNYVLADGNVCHLTYRFYYPSTELSLRYDIDFADVQLDTIEGVSGRSERRQMVGLRAQDSSR